MKKIVKPALFIVVMLFSSAGMAFASGESCTDHMARFHTGTAEEVRASLAEEFARYHPLVEQSLVYRDETIRAAGRLKDKISRGEPLAAEDLDLLNQGMAAHLELRQTLFSVAEAHECWIEGEGKAFEKRGITPELRFEGVMLSLSAALVLYDNYLLAISLFDEDAKLRRFLNDRDPGYEIRAAELSKVTLSYNSAYNRHRVRSAIYFYEEERKKNAAALEGEGDAAYLDQLVSQSPSYSMTKEFSPLYVAGRKVKFLAAMTTDVLDGLGKEGVNLFSMIFGNTIGLVEARRGKLYGRKDVIRKLSGKLQAGDILLEKTPFRLTDKFIPGHWGHAAIWVGEAAELKELGIWEHPVVKKYRKEIEEGRLVVEALRSGVEMNSLADFMNIDDMAVIRGRKMTKAERGETVIRALRQVGKDYDFNFDVETTDRIVCSELVYVTFTGIKWPTGKTLGRATISPDNVASRALKGGPLDLVLFYHDGVPVDKEPVRQMAKLMEVK